MGCVRDRWCRGVVFEISIVDASIFVAVCCAAEHVVCAFRGVRPLWGRGCGGCRAGCGVVFVRSHWLRGLIGSRGVVWVLWQAMKGTWWMPWHREPMKDVGACDKPWGVGNRAVIRGCPNGETWLESCPVTRA